MGDFLIGFALGSLITTLTCIYVFLKARAKVISGILENPDAVQWYKDYCSRCQKANAVPLDFAKWWGS